MYSRFRSLYKLLLGRGLGLVGLQNLTISHIISHSKIDLGKIIFFSKVAFFSKYKLQCLFLLSFSAPSGKLECFLPSYSDL